MLAVFGNCGGSVRDLGTCRAKSNGAVCGRWHSACSLVLFIFGQRSAAVKFWLQRWLLSAARFFGVCACARARASLSLKASLLLGTLLCPGARCTARPSSSLSLKKSVETRQLRLRCGFAWRSLPRALPVLMSGFQASLLRLVRVQNSTTVDQRLCPPLAASSATRRFASSLSPLGVQLFRRSKAAAERSAEKPSAGCVRKLYKRVASKGGRVPFFDLSQH